MDPYDARVSNLIGEHEVAEHDIIDTSDFGDDWAEDTISDDRGQYWEPKVWADPYCDEALAEIACKCGNCIK